MRSPVQSWVPLQESTAERCAFFVYIPSRHRPVGADIDGSDLRACSQGRSWQWHQRAKRTLAWWEEPWHETVQRFTIPLSWVTSKGPKGLEGAAKRWLKHPGSRYQLKSWFRDTNKVTHSAIFINKKKPSSETDEGFHCFIKSFPS